MKHTTMKQLPHSEQPYEKCLQYGAKALSDSQLLAVILRTGNATKNALELSKELLSQNENELHGLAQMSRKDFMSISGIGMVKAMQLECMVELSIRLAQCVAQPKKSLTDPNEVASIYMPRMRFEKIEQFRAVFLDGKCRFISDCIMSVGTINSSLVSPREIFLKALEQEAVYFIVLHNHPSGDPTPSYEDIDVTKRLLSGGELIGIHLLDHIIIGDNKFISMKESKLI